MMDDNRPFPIQRELSSGRWGRKDACTIPWWLAEEVYKGYVKRCGNQSGPDGQSLERLGERGGFGREEVLMLLKEAT